MNDLAEVVARASVVDEVDSMEDSTEVVASEAVPAVVTAHTEHLVPPRVFAAQTFVLRTHGLVFDKNYLE